ncbi:uncharacterized protein YggE [Actinoplanes octamycinicus]|uniref:Uncharacterized protein YggE n=1 Tax=Actinoplanes octamycinicus TaxID=135948 RepID=A0A7W7H4D8_9ACTN|nr:SIMPL domain-containing protein [Actinoplanes octamycinicus]MBB4743756.1 uncharacterized protein YggE [Actinoplanes octamycinicus]GIE61186.1 putative conserved lipoprotein LpqG [Actinoplanes octamycinicus]
MSKPRVTVPALVALMTLAVPSSSLLLAGPAAATPSPASATGAAGGTGAAAPARTTASGAAATASSDDQNRESVLVTGTGKASGEPDVLTASFAVEVTGATVSEALDRASAAATRVRDALLRAGVVKADLQTADVSVNAQRNNANKITGYTVNQGLTAKLRNLPKAGATLTAAIAAGGDAARLNGVSFAIEDDAALLAEARKRAFADARAKAALYAREAGRPLGRVLKITEETPSYYRDSYSSDSVAMSGAAAPIEPGLQQLTVTVTVEWALEPSAGRADSPGHEA